MAITGGIKFFDKNILATDNNTVIAASSGDSSSSFCVDLNDFTYWRSVGSNDAVTETITIDFPSSTSINRIFLKDHNFKSYTIQYNNGSTLVDFANITGLDGTKATISESSYDKDTSYYEFDAVTTSQIVITATETQVTDAEKYLSTVICTTEIGTLDGYPQISNLFKSKNSRTSKSLSGRLIVQKSIETFRTTLNFSNYPAGNTSDIDLCYTLFDRDESFLVWLCGGRYGSDYFKYALRGIRLQDVYQVQVTNNFDDSYRKSVYSNPVKLNLKLEETAL